MASKNPKIFSFFSGAGFLDLGFEKSGSEIVFVNEIHEPFLQAYKYSRERLSIKPPCLGYDNSDINEFLDGKKSDELKSNVEQLKKKEIVGFIGGPPCPDFSVGGKNKGRTGKHGILSDVYVELILKMQPHFFLFENVKGLWRTKKHREYYEELKSKLFQKGYLLTERLINALEYGVPQDRERIILIGFHKEFLVDNGKKTSVFGSYLEKFPWKSHIKYDKGKIFSQTWPKKTEFKEGRKTNQPKNIIPELTVQHWFNLNDVENHVNRVDFFQARAGLTKMQSVEEGDDSKKSYKRLHRWRYSPTACYGNNEVHLHPFYARRLTASEALALQSLPKEFELPEEISLTNKFKMIGNGVPFLAAKGVASSILSFITQ